LGTVVRDANNAIDSWDGLGGDSLRAHIIRVGDTSGNVSTQTSFNAQKPYPSAYWTIRPCFDQANQQGPAIFSETEC
jgi:hypothetical protein